MKKDYIIYALNFLHENNIYIFNKDHIIEDKINDLINKSTLNVEIVLDTMLDSIKKIMTNYNDIVLTSYEEYSRNYRLNEFLS